jgi:glycosyltransferase involved in cell wall biosynthesis
MRIDQFHPQIQTHDAIGNEMVALHGLFRSMGYASKLFARERGRFQGLPVGSITDWMRSEHDLMLIHYSLGSPEFQLVFAAPGHKVLLYHNITPPELLLGVTPEIRDNAVSGQRDLNRCASLASVAVCHSHFSANDLLQAGFHEIRVVPYLLDPALREVHPNASLLAELQDAGWKNLLALGRIVPNKRIEECILVFDHLKKLSRSNWRLLLVGSHEGSEAYLDRLLELCRRLELLDVRVMGLLPQDKLNACLHAAEALLTLSEHEGFGVPALEAMHFGIPVFSSASGALPEVLGSGGVLFDDRDPILIAQTIDVVAHDPDLRSLIVRTQRDELRRFAPAEIRDGWRSVLNDVRTIRKNG